MENLIITSLRSTGSFDGDSYDRHDVFIDLEAAVWTYELRSYGGEQ